MEATTPMIMAPKLLTKPAAGVMATSPVIMPLIPPRKVGLRWRLAKMSKITQVSSATAVARLVLITASDALAPEKYGSPPLKPFQPSHKMPAPAAAINPLVPAAKWITYPPEKSSAPVVQALLMLVCDWAHQPPPHSRNAFT